MFQADGSGGFDVLRSVGTGVVVGLGHLDKPWARDATGKALPTTFSVAGQTVTQHVDKTGAQFPVTADPHFTWGWITGTVYFSKSETIKAAGSAAFIAAIGAFAPPPFDVLLVASAGWYALVATWASADGKCLKIKSTGSASEYSGGYCR